MENRKPGCPRRLRNYSKVDAPKPVETSTLLVENVPVAAVIKTVFFLYLMKSLR